jgi:hypothetical protein
MTAADTVTLREYFERVLDERDRQYRQMFDDVKKAVETALSAQEKAISAAFRSSEQAIEKAELAQNKHNAVTNEYRSQLAEQAQSFIARLEAYALLKAVDEKIAGIQKTIDSGASKSSGFTGGWGAALAIFGLVALALAIASRFIQ